MSQPAKPLAAECPVRIRVQRDGPLRVQGPLILEDAEGRTFGLGGRGTVLLCRCGRTANAPFCDGAHLRGFDSAPDAFDLPEPGTRR